MCRICHDAEDSVSGYKSWEEMAMDDEERIRITREAALNHLAKILVFVAVPKDADEVELDTIMRLRKYAVRRVVELLDLLEV